MTKNRTGRAAKATPATPEEALPTNPIEFARKLKQLVSEDFSKSYRSVKRLVLKH